MPSDKLSRFILTLRILVFVVIFLQLADGILVFASNQKIYLLIGGEIWEKAVSSFELPDQSMLGGIVFLPTVTLIWGLWQIDRLCRLFSKGAIYSLGTVRCFKRFAISLLLLGVIQMLTNPVLVIYLKVRALIPDWPDVDLSFILDSLELEVVTVGVLFFVISKIMETGLEMRQEMELTI